MMNKEVEDNGGGGGERLGSHRNGCDDGDVVSDDD